MRKLIRSSGLCFILLGISSFTYAADAYVNLGTSGAGVEVVTPIEIDNFQARVGLTGLPKEDITLSEDGSALAVEDVKAHISMLMDHYVFDDPNLYYTFGLLLNLDSSEDASIHNGQGDYASVGSGFNASSDLGLTEFSRPLVTGARRVDILSPYLGIGYRSEAALGSDDIKLGWMINAGVALRSGINFTLNSNCPSFDPSTNTRFTSDQFGDREGYRLACAAAGQQAMAEAEAYNSAVSSSEVLPMLQFGVRLRF